MHLDLSDLAQVRTCAQEILARNQPVHGLINTPARRQAAG